MYSIFFFIDEVPDQNMKHVHQDDDGFESLNGNVSSDNDKSTTQATVEKLKQKRDLLKNNEERILWLEDSTSQVLQQKFSGLICNKFDLNIFYNYFNI